MYPRTLRLCIIDMNNAHVNQAMRCLRGLVSTFFGRVKVENPALACELVEVSPRDTNNPVPAVTTSYSYWANTRLHCTVVPANLINNLKWYSDGVSAGTGLTVNAAKASTGANAGYRQATSAVALNNTNHTGLDVASPTDASTYTSGSPLSLTGSTSTAIVFGDFVVFQLAVTASASPGAMSARTYTWQWDET